jgi:flagellar secretion chaperone FliS
MYQSGCKAYRQSAGNIVEDNKVVLIKLYDGALRFLSVARRGIAERKNHVRGENISKVMAIVNELDCALDMEKGGDLSIQLASLYRFVIEKLTAANRNNDLAALGQAESILKTLKEGFEEAARNQKSSVSVPAAAKKALPHQEGVRLAF